MIFIKKTKAKRIKNTTQTAMHAIFQCPICGIIKEIPKNYGENQRTCSRKCASAFNARKKPKSRLLCNLKKNKTSKKALQLPSIEKDKNRLNNNFHEIIENLNLKIKKDNIIKYLKFIDWYNKI